MFERFTDGARETIVRAQQAARERGDNHIGTEHLLLGVLRDGSGLVPKVLESLGVSADSVRDAIDPVVNAARSRSRRPSRRLRSDTGYIPFTPRAKKALELSLRESLDLGHDYIGTEHLLLALIREGEGIAGKVFTRLGVTASAARDRIAAMVPPGTGRSARAAPAVAPNPSAPHLDGQQNVANDLRIGAVEARLAAVEARLAAFENRLQRSDDEDASDLEPDAGRGDDDEDGPPPDAAGSSLD